LNFTSRRKGLNGAVTFAQNDILIAAIGPTIHQSAKCYRRVPTRAIKNRFSLSIRVALKVEVWIEFRGDYGDRPTEIVVRISMVTASLHFLLLEDFMLVNHLILQSVHSEEWKSNKIQSLTLKC